MRRVQPTDAPAVAVGRSFENAITVLYALGGSTNGVLHMLALAKEAVSRAMKYCWHLGCILPKSAIVRTGGHA